ncbi:unnamed protein product [Closterium sp. NIES-54]
MSRRENVVSVEPEQVAANDVLIIASIAVSVRPSSSYPRCALSPIGWLNVFSPFLPNIFFPSPPLHLFLLSFPFVASQPPPPSPSPLTGTDRRGEAGALRWHGELLRWHGELLSWHGELLIWHGELLIWHGELLSWYGELLSWHDESPSWHVELSSSHGESPSWHGSMSHVSCPMSDVSCLMSDVSCPMSHVSCAHSPTSHASIPLTPCPLLDAPCPLPIAPPRFTNYVGKLPDEQFDLIMDLLFDKDKGIGLNLARYLIGGSANYTNSPQFLTSAWETRSIPGFRVQPNGPYDWTADGQQRRTMLAALARNVDDVEAVSYSPPWWMTVSRDTAGTETGKCNLKPEYFQAYTEYQASVIERYRTHWNVNFSTMNPGNEALEGWWTQGHKNEGCNYGPEKLTTLIQLLTATLKKCKLPTKVAGFHSFVGATLRYTYKFPAAVKAGLFRLNVHGYINPPPSMADTRQYMEGVMVSMHRMATGLGKEVWVSEVGPMWVTGNDVGVMLFTARQIVQAVNIMGGSAWIFWQAVSGVATSPDAFLKRREMLLYADTTVQVAVLAPGPSGHYITTKIAGTGGVEPSPRLA